VGSSIFSCTALLVLGSGRAVAIMCGGMHSAGCIAAGWDLVMSDLQVGGLSGSRAAYRGSAGWSLCYDKSLHESIG